MSAQDQKATIGTRRYWGCGTSSGCQITVTIIRPRGNHTTTHLNCSWADAMRTLCTAPDCMQRDKNRRALQRIQKRQAHRG